MKRWKALLGIFLVFLFGMAAGGLLVGKIIQNRVRQTIQGGPSAVADLIIQRLSSSLQLDDRQREQLRVIVKEGQGDLRKIRREADPRLHEVLSRAEMRFREILQPGQREKFDRMMAERRIPWEKADRNE